MSKWSLLAISKALTASVLIATSHWAQADLPLPVAQALKAAQIAEKNVALTVQSLDSDSPSLTHQARQAMNPASVMKLVTTYGALQLLGPAFIWKTGLWGPAIPIEEHVLPTVYLKGSGDPKLTQEQLSLLLRQLRNQGIHSLSGNFILDDSLFGVSPPSRLFDQKPLRPYNVLPSATLIDFQTLRFSLSIVSEQPALRLESPSAGLRIENQLQATKGPCPTEWRDLIQVEPQGQTLVFKGAYALNCGSKTLLLSPLSPLQHAEGLIRALWDEQGGTWQGSVQMGKMPTTDLRLLSEIESPSLAEIVRDINKYSNNVMARQLFLSLSSVDRENGPATLESSQTLLKRWLTSEGINTSTLILENGSGLSRSERTSAEMLNQLLVHAWKSPVMPEFMGSLPIAGMDGTMKKRLDKQLPLGRAHIKTGTLDGVRSAAGYVLDRYGKRHAVTILINDPHAQAGIAAIDALLTWIMQGMPKN